MTNAAIRNAETFADCSGAPAVVSVDGFDFACDLVGEIRVRALGSGGRKPSKRVIALAHWRYSKFIETLPPGYVEANKAMYL